MLDRKRWLVRPEGKQPRSAFEKRPVEYEPPSGETDLYSGHWAKRWATPSVLATYEKASSYISRHSDMEGLTYVVHHFGEHQPTTREIVLDWDKAIKDGKIDSEVQAYVDLFGSYTSYSRSRTGLHTILRVTDCPAFGNLIGRPVGGAKVDVLCANPVAVTGNPLEGFDCEVVTISYEELQGLPFFEYRKPGGRSVDRPEWWAENPLDAVPEHLKGHVGQMEMAPAIEGQGGSQVLFAAACYLARHGIVGREAEVLLRCVPAIPPFDDAQIVRTIECAVTRVSDDGEFNVPTPEFEVIEGAGPSEPIVKVKPEKIPDDGFESYSVAELVDLNPQLTYLVDKCLVGEGAAFIGGRDKTFKTGIAMDLAISLWTGKPFLGHFEVFEQRSSVFFTAEIGLARANTLVRAICSARGVDPRQVDSPRIVNGVPSFAKNKRGGDSPDLTKIKRYFDKRAPHVAVFDPLYFAMGGASAGDLYEIGEILRSVTTVCQEYGVWPIFCHHARKDSSKDFEPMDLNDFYGTGVGAFARQWILLAHAEPFRNGVAKLYANIGGSSQGALGVSEIEIDEGHEDEISNRRWDVTVKDHEADEFGGKITTDAILESLEGHEKGLSSKELAFTLDAERQIKLLESRLRDLTKDGKIKMINRKFSLNEEGDIIL